MKTCLLLALTVFCSQIKAQDKGILNKWKTAVVNMEVRTWDTVGYDAFQKLEKEKTLSWLKMQGEGKITQDQYFDSIKLLRKADPTSRIISIFGTAILLKDAGKRYLITARHVVQDAMTADRRFRYKVDSVYDYNLLFHSIMVVPNFTRELHDTVKHVAKGSIITGEITGTSKNGRFDKQDSVFNEQQITSNRKLFGFSGFQIMSEVPLKCYPYTLSNPNYDLAILSLDNKAAMLFGNNKYKNLGDYLEAEGYVPISLQDIADGPGSEGNDVFSVGFPKSTSTVHTPLLNEFEIQLSSIIQSLPAFIFGRVSMLENDLLYFWTDMSNYPGNSGGPVIENGKMVGIVSAQATYEGQRAPFGKIIKARFVKELLQIQKSKDLCR